MSIESGISLCDSANPSASSAVYNTSKRTTVTAEAAEVFAEERRVSYNTTPIFSIEEKQMLKP
ncbi:MAG TPA: hypothetical protein VNG94_03140, partial [Pyrinomonadaceae bacterium]|nr:hypothetical protein [Pyrinomonadaceae bacterium]